MGKKLYVGNLSFDTTTTDLEELFRGVGTVESAAVITDQETGKSRGFGFVEMASVDEARKAIEQLNGSAPTGRRLNVNDASSGSPFGRGASRRN